VARYRLDFAAGLFSGPPAVVVTAASAADGFGEDNLCVIEGPSPTQVVVACSDLEADVTQRPQATDFSFVAVGPP
jgi:hypothetical protein